MKVCGPRLVEGALKAEGLSYPEAFEQLKDRRLRLRVLNDLKAGRAKF
jgi:hypothetical protein